jgi:hypothetical protein
MAGLRSRKGGAHRLRVSHLTHHDDVGAWRIEDRNAVGKSGASMPTSTCSTTHRAWGCSYSIGSSMVTI